MKAVFGLLLALPLFAFAQSDNSFHLLCRGGYIFQLGTFSPNYNIVFRPSKVAAGPVGAVLEAGTCAWMDRGMSNEEPNRITISYPGTDQFKSGRMLDMYQACALDKKCVIKGRVRNVGSHFEPSFIFPEVSIMTDRTP